MALAMKGPLGAVVASALSLLVGAGVGVAGAAYFRHAPPPPEETSFLNFDAETTTTDVLTYGWAGYEHNDRNDSFVWCMALQCSLLVATHGERDRRLSVRLWPFRFPNAPPQTVTANVNGLVVGTMVFKEDAVVWELTVDKRVWREGKNAVRFDFAYAEPPAGHLANSTDQRPLAAGFDWLEIL
jgi:hypothetical protein